MSPALKVTSEQLRSQKDSGKRLVLVTAYDAAFARLADEAGVDAILVGDSLGMVVQGHDTTLPVTLDDMIYHCRAVVRAVQRAHVIGDLPFMSYQASTEDGLRAAGRLMKESGVGSVKLEGGEELAELVHRLTRSGIPVMGHVGLTPQSVNVMGGFKVQGRTEEQRRLILANGMALEQAGAYALVAEGVPGSLGADLAQRIRIPVIGIGAGPGCDGQVLVMHDLLGIETRFRPRFARRYADLGAAARAAFFAYASDVRDGRFPTQEESYPE